MGKQKGKKLTKRPPQAPPKGGGCERIRWDMGGSLSLELQPPHPPPKEGMCLAGYGMLGVGDIKEKRIKPQRLKFNSQYCRVWNSN